MERGGFSCRKIINNLMKLTAISALHVAMGDSKGGDRGSPPFGASKSLAFAQHKNKEAFPRSLAGMAASSEAFNVYLSG